MSVSDSKEDHVGLADQSSKKSPLLKSKEQLLHGAWCQLNRKMAPIVARMSVDEEKEEKEQKEEQKTPQAEDLTFGALTSFLKDIAVMECVSRYWALLKSFVRPGGSETRAQIKEARVILTSLVIVLFPDDIFAHALNAEADPLTLALHKQAQQLIDEVFAFSPDADGTLNRALCERAAQTIADFLSLFESWKSADIGKVLADLQKYYEEWARSKRVLEATALKEQRDAVLGAIADNLASTRNKMARLIGRAEAETICTAIDARIAQEPLPAVVDRSRSSTPISTPTSSSHSLDTDKAKSTQDKLRARGVPSRICTGLASSAAAAAVNATTTSAAGQQQEDNENNNEPHVIDVDAIAMEEASKKYWKDFATEIEQGQWQRLFELLAEIVRRLKHLSPERDAAHLDDVIDVSFIQQSIDNDAIDAAGFYGIFHAIWTQMNRLHAPALDSAWKAWYEQVLATMQKKDTTWTSLLPNVMNRLLCKLDEIEDAVRAMRPLLKKSSKFASDPASE